MLLCGTVVAELFRRIIYEIVNEKSDFMKYCGYCGEELRDNAMFCTKCGRPCSQKQSGGKKSERKAGRVILKLVGCILVLALFGSGIVGALTYFGAFDFAFLEQMITDGEKEKNEPVMGKDHLIEVDAIPAVTSAESEETTEQTDPPQMSTIPLEPEQDYIESAVNHGMIDAGNYHSVYLRPDGTVAAEGKSIPSKYANRSSRLNVSGWTDIVEVSAASHTVGLKSDGTVVAVGVDRYGQCNVDGWMDIISISAGDNSTLGLHSDGTVEAVGDDHLGQCDVADWRDIIQVSAGAETSYGLRANGTVMAAGGNRSGQKNIYSWSNIVAISAGNYYVVGLKADGTVITAGISEEWKDQYSTWTDIVAISAGSTHMVGLKSDGTVVGCGRNDKGQCDVESWSDIVEVSVGLLFTLGMKSDGSLVAVGDNSFEQLDIVDFV